mgnify:CR=1 FL=1
MKYKNFNEAVDLFSGSNRKMALHFGVSVQTVQYWKDKGQLPMLRVYQLNDKDYISHEKV